MGTLLLRHARVLVTMDDARREIADGGVYARDGWIEAVGATSDLPATADDVVDLSGHVVLPGLVNTHHHLFQTLTRALPGAQDVGLFDWLRHHYPIWARLTPDALRVATTLGLTELALSGCTTAFDHGYLFPPNCRVDDQVEGAAPVGIRFHVARGSMSLGASAGGLPPDDVVEDEDAILADTQRVVAAFHDPAAGAMTRVVVAPCSPFSVTPDAMRRSAELARDLGVRLHTHLAETLDEEDFCRARLGRSPLAFAEEVGWLGDDVWFAHAVHVDAEGVATLAATGTGVAHCPSSNMRLASGIAPIRAYLEAGVPVGIGVHGSASNDSSHLLGEVRQALLVARLAAAPRPDRPGAPLLPVRTVLELATRGGAAVLGRDDIGVLEPGRAADVVAFDLDRVGFAGGLADPVGALLLCQPVGVSHSFVHGRAVVRDGHVVGVDVADVLARHRAAAARLASAPNGY